MEKKHLKIAVTGAAGQIGYALLFRIASGEMLGHETTVDLQLLELEQSLPTLEGVIMELEDCAFPLLKKVTVTSDANQAMRDIDWAILVGAIPRKAGMERSDLLKANGHIFKVQGKAINENASDDVRIFVVGNPCNTNCLIAMHHANDIPQDRFYAMTMLDEKRARAQLAKKANVDVTAIQKMNIWGNHSTTQYPDFYHAKIEGKPALDVIKDESWLQNDFIETIQKRGAKVIEARGASSAASAANAIISSIKSLTTDTKTNETFSVCKASCGEYDVDEGLIFSFPCFVRENKMHVVKGLTHNDFGKEKIKATLEELRNEYQAVKDLGLI